jgi:transcriptional regulator with XRE-family HTH domain|nr:MAG TPA: ESX-1 secretion-associated regulator [Caudoviricetes sp.]
MDIVLERILSLIPKGPDGKYVHGAKTKFAKKIGYNDGAIVAMWENGSSISYNKKLYQIAEEYNVSVEWLQGKTEDKSIKETPDPKIEGVSAEAQEILDYIRDATPAELAEVCRYIGYLKSKRGTE